MNLATTAAALGGATLPIVDFGPPRDLGEAIRLSVDRTHLRARGEVKQPAEPLRLRAGALRRKCQWPMSFDGTTMRTLKQLRMMLTQL